MSPDVKDIGVNVITFARLNAGISRRGGLLTTGSGFERRQSQD
jgi:hypothetical protein